GEWPTGFIDHADRNPSNNRWCNLRAATRSQNNANSIARGPFEKGVSLVARAKRAIKYKAQIRGVVGRVKHLGHFSTSQEAHAAYMAAAQSKYGEFACGADRRLGGKTDGEVK